MKILSSLSATMLLLVFIPSIHCQEEFIKFTANDKEYSINSKNLKKYDPSYVRIQTSNNKRHSYWINGHLVDEKKNLIFAIEIYLPKNKGRHVENGRESYLQEAHLNLICPSLIVHPDANRPTYSTQNNNFKGIDQGETIIEYDIKNNFVVGTFESKIHLYKGRKMKEAIVLQRNAIRVKGNFRCKVPGT